MKFPIALLLVLTGNLFAQGPLTPPPGSDPNIGPANALTPGGLPQATMKTLHQVEPRSAIPGGTGGVVISQSGAYYLAGNIIIAGGDGITINASNVTLDLNGFSITTSATPASGTGVRLGQGLRNVAIRNGNIGGDGVGGAFASGVYYVVSGFPQPPQNLRVADLSVAATEFGISTGNSVASCHVERCLVAGGSVHGIQGGIVKDCVVEGGPIFGRIVKDSSVTTPGSSGIVAEVAENCYATSAGTAIQAKTLVNSYAVGGGNSDVVSAGVVQNVWAEGGSGNGNVISGQVIQNVFAEGGSGAGNGIAAQIVCQASSKRINDANGSATGTAIECLSASQISASAPCTAVSAVVLSDAHAVGGSTGPVISTGVGTNLSALTFGGDETAIESTVLSNSMGRLTAGDGVSAAISTEVGIGLYGETTNSTAIQGKLLMAGYGKAELGVGVSAELVAHSYGLGSDLGVIGALVSSCYGRADNGGVPGNQLVSGVSSHYANGCYGVGTNGSSIGINANTAAQNGLGIGNSAPGANAPIGVQALDFANGMFGRAPGGTTVTSPIKLNSN